MHRCSVVAEHVNPDGQVGIHPVCDTPSTWRIRSSSDLWVQQYACDEHVAEIAARQPDPIVEPDVKT